MDSEIKTYSLVASITEARTYYLFTPKGKELVFLTNPLPTGSYFLNSSESTHTESVVANHLYKLKHIVQ